MLQKTTDKISNLLRSVPKKKIKREKERRHKLPISAIIGNVTPDTADYKMDKEYSENFVHINLTIFFLMNQFLKRYKLS